MPAVRADRLYKVFGKNGPQAVELLADGRHRDQISALNVTAAVIDVSFDVEPGEIFVVMGLSGSGKSTLIRMLNGLLEPSAGAVEVNGTDITKLPSNQLRRLRSQHVSMVFQHFALFPHRTVLENAAYGLEVRGTPRAERQEKAQHALGLVGLDGWENHVPEQLSGGMKQRVGLARALTADTEIILMDEAFSALDPLIRRDMQSQLLELQASLGKTVVFITHDLNEAMRLGDRICMLRDGRVAQIGTAEEILNDPSDDYVANFVEDVDRSRVLTASSVMRPAEAVLSADKSPREGLRVIRESQSSVGYVVHHDQRFVGVIREGLVLRDGLTSASDTPRLGDIADTSVAPVRTNTPVADLFHRAAHSPDPLPVVDGDGRLVGMLNGPALLGALAPDNAATEPPGAGLPGTGTVNPVDPGAAVKTEGGQS
ncbi:glycine betaine/proline transport system ATP-binding protein [Lipingzhangella halophila]|uniref:Glycine betaine/proline transport system ATP-binding protein n=1 Tax=Lipingzhangella halophila TaxID=1783352 RepID=A0A7W7W564_9ACTN|nr:glycine betaine/proline transport system ATP-binding protein [Lipingzhangella halophila]